MQTILGAGGTIGRELALLLPGYTSRIRLVNRHPRVTGPGQEAFAADLSDPVQVSKAVEGSEVVYLTVGLEYKASVWQAQWPPLMDAVLQACERHRAKLVFFDNMYLYDPTLIGQMTEDTPVRPSSLKGRVRAELAAKVLEAHRSGRVEGLIARSADFYGPHNEKSMLVEMIVKNLRKGKAANWIARKDAVHSFTYTPDAAKATAFLGNTPAAYGQTWHLPTDPARLTMTQYTALIGRALGQKPAISVLPTWLLRPLGLFVPVLGEVHEMAYQYDRDYFFDSSKITKAFGLRATSYEAGIREMLAVG